jgi:hypothetical protein
MIDLLTSRSDEATAAYQAAVIMLRDKEPIQREHGPRQRPGYI